MSKPSSLIPVAITMGDPAGIGPEVVLKALSSKKLAGKFVPVLVGLPAVFERAARLTRAGIRLRQLVGNLQPGRLDPGFAYIVVPRAQGVGSGGQYQQSLGSLSSRGRVSYACIDEAVRLCNEGQAAAVVTAPLSKASLAAAGLRYPGHTEMLKTLCGSRNTLMMFVRGRLKISLVTTHVPVRLLAYGIRRRNVDDAIRLTNIGLERLFSVRRPRLAVLSLNPHAGEDSSIGSEEASFIRPAVRAARKRGIHVEGPFPADSFFAGGFWSRFDATVAMYHDQALIPAKLIGKDQIVNLTLGLPFVRTSPGHGTAPDIAWQGKARPDGMISAMLLAVRLAKRQRPPLEWSQ